MCVPLKQAKEITICHILIIREYFDAVFAILCCRILTLPLLISNPGRSPMLPNQLNNKLAIVTGGSRGIGAAIARKLAAMAANVVIWGRNKGVLQRCRAMSRVEHRW